MRILGSLLCVIGAPLLLHGCSDASGPAGPDPTDPPNDPGENEPPPAFNSEAAPGDSARAFLDDRQFTVLSLEVDYMEGFEPTPEGLNDLKASLSTHLNKSSIHIASPTSIPAAGEGPYSSDAIRSLEEIHRDHYTRAQSDTVRAYFLVVDGMYETENVVGIAYYNTSMAFFGPTINEISGGVTQPSRGKVEATVFRHEFGHNLGLVDNGIPMQEAHRDDGNGRHCTNEQCVMYHTIETTDYFSTVFDGTVPGFERFCTSDMDAQDGTS